LYEPNIPEVNAAAVEEGVRRVRQRPLLYGLLVVAFFAFGLWYMTGGSATGSPRQAEQLILAGGGADPTYGLLAPQATAATVHCTQNSQGFFVRLYGLVGGGSGSNQSGRPSNEPPTYYTCDGTSTTGQPMYWCVTYPPRMDHFDQSPKVTGRLPNTSCPS
jgi:hypothetical protein